MNRNASGPPRAITSASEEKAEDDGFENGTSGDGGIDGDDQESCSVLGVASND